MKYKKNQEENFIFECVREILFLYQFTVRTLYIVILNQNPPLELIFSQHRRRAAFATGSFG